MLNQRLDLTQLQLPEPILNFIGGAPVYESSGCSGARTVYIDTRGGAYLKISGKHALASAARMQAFFHARGQSSAVLEYLSLDRDYLITAPLAGEDGTAPRHLAQPERLSALFGEALRALHAVDFSGCPVTDALGGLIAGAKDGTFDQAHLDNLAPYIGPARAEDAAEELKESASLLKFDALLHGDYCLPNIMIDHWKPIGFIDLAEGGVGDRHYDLAWGLWTIRHNLKDQAHGERFLDAYGRDAIEPERLRVCALIASLA